MTPIRPTPEQLSHLNDMLAAGDTYVAISRYLGVNVDTLKRILVREGLSTSITAAKYVAAEEVQMWTRPCMGCKSTAPRPKNLYFCDDCRPEDDGTPDASSYFVSTSTRHSPSPLPLRRASAG